jgi:hypothetical protein
MYPADLKKFETNEHFAKAFSISVSSPDFGTTVPLYTSPPKREWVGLTEEETIAIVDKHTFDENGYSIYTDGEAVARAVELVLKGKNQ